MFAALVAEVTLRDGGATANAHTREFLGTPDTPTYVVGGLAPTREYDVRGFGPNEAYAALSQWATGAAWVGTWVDGGKVHVDLVDLWSSRDAALATATFRSERAVYAAHTGETLWTPGNGPEETTGPSDLEDPALLMLEDAARFDDGDDRRKRLARVRGVTVNEISDAEVLESFQGTARNGQPYDTRYDCHVCGKRGGH
jgi:hypothetical protein